MRLRDQRLADRVVDLVRAGVREVLALQVHAHAELLARARGEVERRRPAGVVRRARARAPRQNVGVVAQRRPRRRRAPRPRAPASRARSARRSGRSGRPRRAGCERWRRRARRRRTRASFARSLRPGRATRGSTTHRHRTATPRGSPRRRCPASSPPPIHTRRPRRDERAREREVPGRAAAAALRVVEQQLEARIARGLALRVRVAGQHLQHRERQRRGVLGRLRAVELHDVERHLGSRSAPPRRAGASLEHADAHRAAAPRRR